MPPSLFHKTTYQATLYYIAEEAHKGCDDAYIRELCTQLAKVCDRTTREIYRACRAVYDQEFV